MLASCTHFNAVVIFAMHISGVLVHASPDRISQVRDRLSKVDGVEIHAADEDGKLIITIEKEDGRSATDFFEELNKFPGVLSATMVYHHF